MCAANLEPDEAPKTQAPFCVRIVVNGCFRPGTVAIRAGRPHRLLFRREETTGCSEHVIFPTIGRDVSLPAFEDVAIDLPAMAPGTYPFTCARGALHGRLVVRDSRRNSAKGRLR